MFIGLHDQTGWSGWYTFETLNNRYVALNLKNITYCVVNRDEADQPKVDWEHTYFENILPEEMYRGLSDYSFYDDNLEIAKNPQIFEKNADSTYSVAWIDCLEKNNFGRHQSIVTVATMSERRDAVHKWALLELGSSAQFAHRLRVNGRSQLVLLAVRLELIYADESSAEELQWSRLITSLASIRPDAAASLGGVMR